MNRQEPTIEETRCSACGRTFARFVNNPFDHGIDPDLCPVCFDRKHCPECFDDDED